MTFANIVIFAHGARKSSVPPLYQVNVAFTRSVGRLLTQGLILSQALGGLPTLYRAHFATRYPQTEAAIHRSSPARSGHRTGRFFGQSKPGLRSSLLA